MDPLQDIQTIYSLSTLAEKLRFSIYRSFPDQVWVQAEVAKKNIYPRSGHVYLDLVEKEKGATLAQFRGIIWANDYPAIQEKFEKTTRETFREGLKILFLARFNFHPTYGLSLWISDVEPSFTLGDLSRVKSQTIDRLREEKLFDLNKELPIPSLPLRIAVISAETSKGYLDFIQVIRQHTIPYRFEVTLFPALLQGDKAVDSIRNQLNLISGFDLVAIIRGGGDEIGLTCFDDYTLAKDICTFPLPVVTGIGHSTNETVCEMVAALNRITPTEVAYDLLGRLDTVYETLMATEAELGLIVKQMLSVKHEALLRSTESLHTIMRTFVRRQRSDLEHKEKTLRLMVGHFFSSRKSLLDGIEGQVRNLDPKRILQRGYSMTFDQNGRILKDASRLKPGDKIRTELANGTLRSTIDHEKRDDI
ncbi:exodeoxyribonuclease VII large subunit [Bacteroidota bacterium]